MNSVSETTMTLLHRLPPARGQPRNNHPLRLNAKYVAGCLSGLIVFGASMLFFYFLSHDVGSSIALGIGATAGIVALIFAAFLRPQEPLYAVNLGQILGTIFVGLIIAKTWESPKDGYRVELQSGNSNFTMNLVIAHGPRIRLARRRPPSPPHHQRDLRQQSHQAGTSRPRHSPPILPTIAPRRRPNSSFSLAQLRQAQFPILPIVSSTISKG
jgi:hypothetical protein